jgi:hypothetical protein
MESRCQQGLSTPDEATAKDRCLGEGVDAPALPTMKDSLRFYVAASRGKVVQRTTADLVNTFAEWFFFSPASPVSRERRPMVKKEGRCIS